MPEPDNPRRIDVVIPAPPDPLLVKRIGLDASTDQLDRALVICPVKLLPERDAEAARARVAIALAVLDPLAGFAGRLGVGRTDLQRREQAQFQSQAVGLQGLADLGQGGDVGVGVGREAAWFAFLSRAVLFPELVEGKHDPLSPPGLRLLADLAQGHDLWRGAEADVNGFVRVLQVQELLVGNQDEPRLGTHLRWNGDHGIGGHVEIDRPGQARRRQGRPRNSQLHSPQPECTTRQRRVIHPVVLVFKRSPSPGLRDIPASEIGSTARPVRPPITADRGMFSPFSRSLLRVPPSAKNPPMLPQSQEKEDGLAFLSTCTGPTTWKAMARIVIAGPYEPA